MSEPTSPESDRAASKRRGAIALSLALLSVALFAGIRSTVAGTSGLATQIMDGNDATLLLVVIGFAVAAISGISALLISVEAISENRGRRRGIIAIILSVSAPLVATLF